MAFSMFLRSTGHLSPVVNQQMSRLVTLPAVLNRALTTFLPASSHPVMKQHMSPLVMQRSVLTRAVTTCLPASNLTVEKKDTTPITNTVRSFRTTSARLQEEEHPHDHATLWIVEKSTTALMVLLIPPFLIMPNKFLDCIVAILVCAHSFWGLEAIAVDYVRASIFGPLIPKIAIGLVYAVTFATLGGLFYITFHDVGVGNSIRSFWAIKSEQKA